MPREDYGTDSGRAKPVVIGTGLVALDVVVNVDSDGPPRCYAGGTCGNVLAALAYRGWEAAPVSRLAPGSAADRLLADLAHWRVSARFVSLSDDGSTPVIIQRISRTTSGEPYHTFSWRCPGCGTHLPGFKPVLASAARELALRLPAPQVFFFDRVSRGALHLACAAARAGAVIVFEPSGVGDPGLFREAWALAHIVKYSHERLRDIADIEMKRAQREAVLLEVETLGADGLRYRSRLPKGQTGGWRHLGAFKPETLKDTAGSGDWCTAGLLDQLARGGLRGLQAATAETLHDALRYGQVLATWNCGFEGPRGGMYEVDKATFERFVERTLKGMQTAAVPSAKEQVVVAQLLGRFCPSCITAELPPRTLNMNGSRVPRN